MLKVCISKDWKFKRGISWNVKYNTDEYIKVDLPHDYMISAERRADAPGLASTGYYDQQPGRYVKYLNFEENKHYILDVDGAYMCAQVQLNENYIALHPHGYTPFLVDLTPYILKDTINKLAINVTPTPTSSRWYPGNGIYRDVFLWQGGAVRLEPWDMFISTDSITENSAKIRLKYSLAFDLEANINTVFSVIDKNGKVVADCSVASNLKFGEKHENTVFIDIPSPLLWDMENPNLYTLKTEIFSGDELLDEAYNTFGIRTISISPENGLLLNGKSIKLRGGCIHHDHGALGAAAFPAAEERKVRLLQKAGFNALRIAHNPPSLALLEVCDRLGVVVMDEAFDMWRKGKNDYDYHLFFDDWCLRDISYMVMRDRNHPSVFSYSIGNEIPECNGLSNAGEISKMLVQEVKKYDDTKPVTSAVWKGLGMSTYEQSDPEEYKVHFNSKIVEGTDEEWLSSLNKVLFDYESPLDMVGCNYFSHRYGIEHKNYPNRVLWNSETKALDFYDTWSTVVNNSFVLGDFTWTAIDNMGEAGTGKMLWQSEGTMVPGANSQDYPWRNCYQGDLDLCGYRRPQSYFREAVWIGGKEPRIFVTHPKHFGESYSGTTWHWADVSESWTFDDKYVGRQVKAECYTDADRVEWYVNGKLVGESKPDKCIAYIETIYEKGEITAVAFKDGAQPLSYTLKTVGSATAINISPESNEFLADNRDLCYFDISVVDANGDVIVSADDELVCSVNGGELMAFYSGNPCNEDNFASNRCHAFNGRALAVVRANKAGCVNVIVHSKNLASGTARVLAK